MAVHLLSILNNKSTYQGHMRRLAHFFTPRILPLTLTFILCCSSLFAIFLTHSISFLPLFVIFLFLTLVGLHDILQEEHSVLRNYPITAHLRFILEEIRPELRQYFMEDETHGFPFSRDKRAIVYQRAKLEPDKRPFGTQLNVYDEGYEWMMHSLSPSTINHHDFRIHVGGETTTKPYEASLFNISAMSFGALSANAIRALNAGAKAGHFAHNTGEGGYTPYHHEHGGDIIWEIGSGYFGCRHLDGKFDPEKFAAQSINNQIKMIELKLSQGAKPGHGGLLPGSKVTAEIASIRGVAVGKDCVSPAAHTAFTTPLELVEFIEELRKLSGRKPVGFKLCIGKPEEFFSICKAMLDTGLYPDFITIDGKEGGTGSAPLEFMDHIGMPLREGLTFVHNSLIGIGLRDKIRLAVAGKIITAFDIARAMALGADWCNSARGFMFSLGCIQSLKCHTDHCPTGIATQDPARMQALVIPNKAQRVFHYHLETMKSLAELTAAAGYDHPRQLKLSDFYRRINEREIASLRELDPQPQKNSFHSETIEQRFYQDWRAARPDRFHS